jgi:hypothetical protein
MRTTQIGLLFLVSNVLYAWSTPLPLKVDLGEKGDKGKYLEADVNRLHEANAIANLQIHAMHRVVQNPDREEHKKILVNTFGKHYDIGAIKGHVDKLMTGTVQVADVRDKSMPNSALAKTKYSGKPNANIRFGPAYHDSKKTNHDRAGTLIHEASHALLGTKDFFKKSDKTAIVNKSDAKKGDAISGYMNQYRYKLLRDDPKSKMHQNADSWKAFGHHALTGKPHPHLNDFIHHTGSTSAGTSKRRPRFRAQSAHTRPLFPPPSRSRSPQRGATRGRSQSTPPRP